MPNIRWIDADEIGYQLSERFPDIDPLTVSFVDLRGRVEALEDFDDPGKPSEPILEAIQMAWLEYFRENR